MRKTGVGLIGSQFISAIHYAAFQAVHEAEVVAVASPTEDHVRRFAAERDIKHWFTDCGRLLEMPEVELVVLGVPNDLHCQITCQAAAAGKHVVLEKPLAMNLAECDSMIAACAEAGVQLMYAEELCFAPKYVRMKQLVDSGAVGRPYLIKQSERHSGPHSAWFYDVNRSGGGVTMDMGCHALEFFRWILSGPECKSRPAARSVYAQMATHVHSKKTRGDDNALIIVEFDNGCTALAEESWAKPGGMDDRAEVYGTEGVCYADLLRGNSLQTFSTGGYDYAVEKAGATKGWSYTIYEEAWNYGFPQEMQHFVSCVREGRQPIVTGQDGRAVLELVMAAYLSAGQGRKVELPLETDAARPIDLWRPQ